MFFPKLGEVERRHHEIIHFPAKGKPAWVIASTPTAQLEFSSFRLRNLSRVSPSLPGPVAGEKAILRQLKKPYWDKVETPENT
jgi:hypothetical protein